MATKKSKTSKKPVKASTTKPKTAAKTVKKPEVKAPKTKTVDEKKTLFKGFFARKYDEKESILTVFKNPKFYGALLGEVLGTLLIATLVLSLWPVGLAWGQSGNANIAIYSLAILATIAGVYAFSGACLNPLVTAGMMATRRMSVIRGVMYIIAEIIGAWFGWLIINAFHLAGGESAMDVPAMAAIPENGFWLVAMVELVGAIFIGFFFARALSLKRSVFTFAAIVTGGIMLAYFVGFIVSAAYVGLNNNFVMNPAVAMMFQIFPTTGENFGEILGGICQALSVYAILPMFGGVVGFYLSDFASRLADEK